MKKCVLMKQSAELRAREQQLGIIFRGQDWGQKSPHKYNPLISLELKMGVAETKSDTL